MDPHVSTPAPPSTSTTPVPRSVLMVGVAVVALFAVALITALALPHAPASYPAGSPEAVFQAYYQAWERRDLEAAHARLSPGVRAGVSLAEYRRFDAERTWQRDQDRRIVLIGSDVVGDRATLHLRIEQFHGGGLGAQRSSSERSVPLVLEAGSWTIDEPLVGLESTYGY